MSSRTYKPTTIKRLFALSGNICAYTDCSRHMIDENGNVVGIICHIEAASAGGTRYNDKQSDDDRRDFANLMLMCQDHHKKIDNEKEFTVQKLKELKKNHEKKYEQNQYVITEDKFPQLMEQLLSKLDTIEKNITLIPTIKQDTSKLTQQNDEIIDILTNQKIENAFDLKQKSAKTVVSKMSQISKKLQDSSEDYDYNVNISNDSSSIEITHKQFDKMNKDGMIFETTLKLNNQKIQNLNDLIKDSKDGKIVINAEEIEEISISRDGKSLYVASGLPTAQLTIERNKPKPRLIKLVILGRPESLDYVLMTVSQEGDLVKFTNEEQKDYPFELRIIHDTKSHEVHLSIDPRKNIAGIAECYDYVKLLASMSQVEDIVLMDKETNKPIISLKSKGDGKPVEPFWLDFFRKLSEIQRLSGISIPWPPIEISVEERRNISALYDILTTGKTTGSISSDMKFQKGEIAAEKLIEELKRIGYWKAIFNATQEQEFQVFGKIIKVGKYKITGKLTTDMAPHEFIDKYDKTKDGEIITAKMISLGGKAKFEYIDWPKSDHSKKK